MEWQYLAFEVYPKESEDGALAECPIMTLADIICSLANIEYQGFISPLHVPDSLTEHQQSGKFHFHVALQTGGRFTQRSCQATLDSCGVRYANRLIIRLAGKQDYVKYCKYLCHRTYASRDKQQFPQGTLAFPVNQPLGAYADIFRQDYQHEVMQLITEQQISSPVQLYDAVCLCCEEYADMVWRDLNKWACFFMADRLSTYS